MNAQPLPAPRFIRKTQLAPGEYRKNFHQLDHDVIAAVTSVAADRVTPLMSKIYLRLVTAPTMFWEREGVLYFAPRDDTGQPVKASKALYKVLGVASATAHKALRWLHEQGIIGYFAGKNGVGIRIFLNRAASSIGVREQAASKKILPFARGSNDSRHGSSVEPAFKDSFAVLESLDSDHPGAPKCGADKATVSQTNSIPESPTFNSSASVQSNERGSRANVPSAGVDAAKEISDRLKHELSPCIEQAATQAAKQIAMRELERTREWFETKALPKAVRVAQRETYDLLRKHAVINDRPGRSARPDLEIGRAPGNDTSAVVRTLTSEEIQELAEACVALLEVQGKAIEATLAGLSSAEGGWLLPQDIAHVRESAQARVLALHERGNCC
jgi:hypothetical protein